MPITDTEVRRKNILIHKQETTKDVFNGNTVGTVENGKMIISILNISEVERNVINTQ